MRIEGRPNRTRVKRWVAPAKRHVTTLLCTHRPLHGPGQHRVSYVRGELPLALSAINKSDGPASAHTPDAADTPICLDAHIADGTTAMAPDQYSLGPSTTGDAAFADSTQTNVSKPMPSSPYGFHSTVSLRRKGPRVCQCRPSHPTPPLPHHPPPPSLPPPPLV